jgi:hypothetical protein
MKRIRLVQAGYQNFTGEMGHIQFRDGVSVHTLNPDFVRSLAAIVQLEEMPSDTPEGSDQEAW